MSKLFRQKSLDRISSPEQLNAYIRVSTPSVWLLLTAIVILLIGVCVWGVWGHMDTTLPVVAVADQQAVIAYVRVDDRQKVEAGAQVFIGDNAEGSVLAVGNEPLFVDGSFTDYMRHVGGLQAGEWVYAVKLAAECPEGVYAARIVIDSVSPISFVLN